ncbi:MAG: 50S ribosomal protein L29 [Firmicutes bacterium]|jgi:large subunit ribosomal protein L29|nr:50S ribosomal protein L29 [Bacillota bacterium]
MKASDLRKEEDQSLRERLAALKTELFRLRFQAATGQLDKPSRIREVRRDIARVETILRQHELGIPG